MNNPERHVVILGANADQGKDPLPEKLPGMEFWAQNALEQFIEPKTSYGEFIDSDLAELAHHESVSNVAMLASVVDRWYEIHMPELTAEMHPNHVVWLAESNIQVYTQRASCDDPYLIWRDMNHVEYPIGEVQGLTPHGCYLAGTFSYMVAHAILEGVDRISFHWMAGGVLRSPREPHDAQDNLEYWLGVAEGRGIIVDAGDLWLLKTWWDGRYGYDGQPPEWHENKYAGQYSRFILRLNYGNDE